MPQNIYVKYITKTSFLLKNVEFLPFFLGMFLPKSELELIPGNHNFLLIFLFIYCMSNMRIIVSHFKIFGKIKSFDLPNVP